MKPGQQTLAGAFAAASIVVVGIAGLTVFLARRQVASALDAERSNSVLQSLDRLLLAMVNAETGEHGFLISGDSAFLGAYIQAFGQRDRELARLDSLVSDSIQHQRLVALRRDVDRHLLILDSVIRLRVNRGAEAANRFVAAGAGKAGMDSLRATIASLRVSEAGYAVAASSKLRRMRRLALSSILTMALLLPLGLLAAFLALRRRDRERDRLVVELQTALAQVRDLSGLLPICASCKKIRNDEGFWRDVDVYLRDHTDVKVSHGLCQECVLQLYGTDESLTSPAG